MYYILKFIARFPLGILQRFAICIAIIMQFFNYSIKRNTHINLKVAYPTLSDSDHHVMLNESIKSQYMTYLESIKCWGMPAAYSLSLLKNIYGEEHFVNALANKKGVILVVPHFGCWELLNAWINVYAQPLIMYKPNKVAGINRYLLEARQKSNAKLVPTDESGIRAIFKHLKMGGLTVVLPDHVPKQSGGIYSLFYGQNTLSSTLVSKLAQKTQCNVIGLSCIRNTDHRSFDVHCTRLSHEILSKNLQHSVDCLNQEMQRIIDGAPEQYIWSYKRFRKNADQINIYKKS